MRVHYLVATKSQSVESESPIGGTIVMYHQTGTRAQE